MIATGRRAGGPHAPPRRTLVTAARPRWTRRVSAVLLVAAVIASLGGGGLLERAGAYSLQARAAALHERWASMRAGGVPAEDLAPLEQQWKVTQADVVAGAAALFWMPGGADVVVRWEAESDAIWARVLGRMRSDAITAERALHRALAPEAAAVQQARREALAGAATPLEFAALRDEWMLEARLVPIDRRIAALVAAAGAQTRQASALGIRADPAPSVLARATAFAGMLPSDRLARAEFLSRDLVALQTDLKNRLAAATTASQALQQASSKVAAAAVYGINVSSYEQRIAADRRAYASALTAAGFTAITADLKQIGEAADRSVGVVLGQTHVIGGVAMIYQSHPLSCEEAATSMALTHQGIDLSQDQILREVGADLRPMYEDAQGRVRWGNPYKTFVGSVDGSQSDYTGFGTFYPPLVRVARAHGARILAYGSMSAASIYARVIAGHPVVAFATWDWAWHPRHDYVSFDGRRIPWIGPEFASHVYVVVGVTPTRVLVDDPARGQYWISKASFEAGYSDFLEAIVFA